MIPFDIFICSPSVLRTHSEAYRYANANLNLLRAPNVYTITIPLSHYLCQGYNQGHSFHGRPTYVQERSLS